MKRKTIFFLIAAASGLWSFTGLTFAASVPSESFSFISAPDDDDDDDLAPRSRSKKPNSIKGNDEALEKALIRETTPGKKIKKPWFMGGRVLLGNFIVNGAKVGNIKLWLHPDGTYRFLNSPAYAGEKTDIRGKYDWDGEPSSYRLFLYNKDGSRLFIFKGENNSLGYEEMDGLDMINRIKLWPADDRTNFIVYPRENKY